MDEKELTLDLLKDIYRLLTKAYILESKRSESEHDESSDAARMITNLKIVRGILRGRLKALEQKEKNNE